MKYKGILDCSIADGEGIRVVIFLTGCSHHCKGCHNPECWDSTKGKLFNEEALNKLIHLLGRDYIDGLTWSGGDPMFIDNRDEVARVSKIIKEKFPNKNIWCYTGYKYEELKNLGVLNNIDVLVDGKFEIDKRDITLPFRGSSNQRIIKMIH